MGTHSARSRAPFVLGDWTIDPSTGEIRRSGERGRLEPRVMEVLLHLVAAEGAVVPKEELFATVWEGAAVTDDVLRRCIYSLRTALGDSSEQPRYIRTLPRRGYQVVARVSALAPVPAEPTNDFILRPASRTPRPAAWRRPTGIGVAAALMFAALGVWGIASSDDGSTVAPPSDGRLLLADGSPLPNSADELFELASHHAERRGANDVERAIALYAKALELEPDHALAHAALANAYALSVRGYFRDLDRFDLAIDHATLALGLDPDLAEANKALGIAFAGKGWLSSAAREYERALELQPDYQAVINNLAIVEISRGNLDRALELQLQLDRSTPTRGLYLNNLGHTYRLLGDYQVARRVLEASFEAGPHTANATINLAAVDMAEGRFVAARDRVRETLPRYRDDAPFLASAGLVELAAGDLQRAEELFRLSAELSAAGTNNIAWLGLAYLHLQRDEVEAAENIFTGFYAHVEESRRLRREHWVPHYNMTAIHAMTGNVAEALDELEKAVAGGYVDVGMLRSNPFFRSLRDSARFDAIVSDLQARVAKMRVEAEAATTQ